MNKYIIAFAVALICCWATANTQTDNRTVVGVSQFTCDVSSPYTSLVTEKVVEMLTNTHRFQVVDRTSREKIEEELELQKSEAFLDSKNTADQYSAVAAEMISTGHIIKIPVYAVKNRNGYVRGYTGSVAFQLKIVDVETGISTEATSFQGKTSEECLSAESAVTMAMQSLQNEIYEYFRINFPVTATIDRCLSEKTILIGAGKEQGIKVGVKFTVESIEIINNRPYPTTICECKVKKLAGESFAECEVSKKYMKTIGEKLQNGISVRCSLIIK